MMSRDGAILPTPVQPRSDDHYRELLRCNFIRISAMVLFRREAVELAGGFDRAVNSSADYGLYLNIARHYPVCYHGQLVAYCRRHATDGHGNAATLLRETLAVLRSQRPFLAGDRASQAAFRKGWRRAGMLRH